MKKLNTYCSIGCLSVVLSILSSCSTSRQEFDISYKLIPVDARWDKTPEPLMEQIVDKYKTSVDSIMSIVIGKSSQYMAPGRPETSLTNLSADIIKPKFNEISVNRSISQSSIQGGYAIHSCREILHWAKYILSSLSIIHYVS